MNTPTSLKLLGVMLLALLPCVAKSDENALRQRINIDTDWRFQKGDPAGVGEALAYATIKDALLAPMARFLTPGLGKPAPAVVPPDLGKSVAYVQPGFNDGGWRQLNLPHDWGIEGPFKMEYPGETGKLPWWGVGWYRKHFDVPAADADRRCFLDIDGAMSYAVVWCNGHFVGGWPYGYASWQVDLTPFLKPGESNLLAIRLDNPADSSRWYPGGGIYRHVWLEKTAPVHVAHWGSYVTTPEVTDDHATVTLRTTVDNQANADADLTIRTDLFECGTDGHPTGAPVGIYTTGTGLSGKSAHVVIKAGGSQDAYEELTVSKPKLWDSQHPNRYVAVTTVEQDGKAVDRCETIFGVRTISFTTNNGFLLNGKRVPLQGVCLHADLGALGSALNDRALERHLEILRGMGCNAIRTSHNPPAPELVAFCDQMGMLVIDEAFDCWEIRKKPNGYNLLFDDWHQRDLRALVRRDRNHPSVILWSIGNEINEQWAPEGPIMAAELSGEVRLEDYSRPTSYACSTTEGGYNGYQKGVDVFGYNYRPGEYGKFRAFNPTIPIMGSETASAESSRGEYFFPVTNANDASLVNFQVTSYDLQAGHEPDVEWKGLDEFPFTAGEFVWTGFDYLGEPSPYMNPLTKPVHLTDPARQVQADKELKDTGEIIAPSRSSYFGLFDLAGFPKDRAYLYQSRWRPDFPMAHLLPHWTWPERVGQVTPVYVYTSGDEAELFLNGKSLGRRKKEAFQYRLQWNEVKYALGELKVIAYKSGELWATDSVRTAEPAAKLVLQADRPQLAADGKDLSFVSVTITDSHGVPAPSADNPVKFTLSGPADLVATDNGDATSLESFQSPVRRAFSGKCLAIVRTRAGAVGTITVRAEVEGMPAAALGLQSR